MNSKDIENLLNYVLSQDINYGDGDSFLTFIYESYLEYNNPDDERVKTDFSNLYKAMEGKTLKEIDKVLYVVCDLCRDHERLGFDAGIKLGMRLAQELQN